MDEFCFQKLWDIVFDRFFSDAQFENRKKVVSEFSTHRTLAFFLEVPFQNILSLLRIYRQKTGLECPYFASRSSETSHSIYFFPVLNLKMEKKSFRKFQPIESGAQFKKSKRSRKQKFFYSETSPDWMSLKFQNDCFSVFKLRTGQKDFECDVPDGRSNPGFCLCNSVFYVVL